MEAPAHLSSQVLGSLEKLGAQGGQWKAMHAVRERAARGEDWAAVDTADLGGGGHADLRDKCVIKKAENLLLLHLLGWGVFGRRRDRWAFPELWASKGGSMGGVAEHSTGRQRQSHGYVSQSLPGPWRKTNKSLLP